jgi:2-methylisocitrate lyase-like PEP mutase family enzyme
LGTGTAQTQWSGFGVVKNCRSKTGDNFGIDVGVGGLRIEDQILKTQNSKLKTQKFEVNFEL